MKKKLKERLKDIIIDFIYDYCWNEVVKKIESGNIKVEFTDGCYPIENDKVLNDIVTGIKKSGGAKLYHGTRDTEYCKVLRNDGKAVNIEFMNKLEFYGYKSEKALETEINLAIKYLQIRSYLVHNLPDKSELKLTEKGRSHYNSGKSFEAIYLKDWLARRALWVSIASIIIAITSVIISFIINHSKIII